MGWDSRRARNQIRAEHLRSFFTSAGAEVSTLEHYFGKKDEDWFLRRLVRTDGTEEVYAEVVLWDGDAHKTMDTSVGPYCTECPREWLARLSPPVGEFDAAWRTRMEA